MSLCPDGINDSRGERELTEGEREKDRERERLRVEQIR
jgi:hypothetical protein